VALHLARKDNRIELEVRAGIRKVGHLPGGKDVLFPVGVDIDDSFFPKPIEVVWLRTLVGAVPPSRTSIGDQFLGESVNSA
jgi:hypothetical protein